MSRLLKVRNPTPFRTHEGPQISSYDPESGLGFTETVLRSGPMRAEWVWWSEGDSAKNGLYRRNSGTGAPSLRSIAIRSTSANASLLSPEVMKEVPWVVAQDVWKELKINHLDNLHVWKAFVVAYASEPDAEALKLREQVIHSVNMYLEDYVRPITAPSFKWITFLTLNDVTCSRSELINISQLTNLGVLTIGSLVRTPDGGINDSILRCWARESTERKTFSKLKVLACRRQGRLTTRTFEYLGDLVAMNTFILEECSIDGGARYHAESSGWKCRNTKALDALLEKKKNTANAWDFMMKALYTHGQRFEHVTETCNEANDCLPILEMSLGGRSQAVSIDFQGKIRLNYFARSSVAALSSVSHRNPSSDSVIDAGGKRQTDKPGVESSEKRKVKRSKQTHVENTFTEFGL